MKTWKLLMLCIVVSIIAVSVVSAKEDSSVVKPVSTSYIDNIASLSTSIKNGDYKVTQGETDTTTLNLGDRKVKSLTVECVWDHPKNALTLTVITPSGEKHGPFSDSYDGATDGHIGVKITKSSGVFPKGKWQFKVYGKSVSGTETYTRYGSWK